MALLHLMLCDVRNFLSDRNVKQLKHENSGKTKAKVPLIFKLVENEVETEK